MQVNWLLVGIHFPDFSSNDLDHFSFENLNNYKDCIENKENGDFIKDSENCPWNYT